MRNLIIGGLLVIVLMLASCGGSQQVELQDDTKVSASVSQSWVTSWNAHAPAYRFNTITSWNASKTFGSLYNGSNFAADAFGFTGAMSASRHNPALPAPTSGSTVGIWYDGIDDLE